MKSETYDCGLVRQTNKELIKFNQQCGVCRIPKSQSEAGKFARHLNREFSLVKIWQIYPKKEKKKRAD